MTGRLLAAFADQAAIAVRNAELYQQASEEREALSAIIENSADGVLILDAAGRVQVFNRALGHMTGWNEQQALWDVRPRGAGPARPAGRARSPARCGAADGPPQPKTGPTWRETSCGEAAHR